jgi:hypothetical protein
VAEFVTREEFEMVKAKQDELIIRVESIDRGLASLTIQVAELAESMERRFDALNKKIDDGNAALMSAILQLGRR